TNTMTEHWSYWTVALSQVPHSASHCIHGYDMAATTWQLLFVDDDPDFCRQVQEFLDGETIPPDDRLQVQTLNDFGDALNELETYRFDLLILDVRLGPHSITPDEEAGTATLRDIRQRRFIPGIFYT